MVGHSLQALVTHAAGQTRRQNDYEDVDMLL